MAFFILVLSKHDKKKASKMFSTNWGEKKKGPYNTHNNSAQTGII